MKRIFYQTYQLGLLVGLLANMSQLLLQRAFLLVQLIQGLLYLLTLRLEPLQLLAFPRHLILQVLQTSNQYVGNLFFSITADRGAKKSACKT